MAQMSQKKGGGWLFNYDQHRLCDCQTKRKARIAGKQKEESVNI